MNCIKVSDTAGKTYIDKLEQKIRLGGARVVAEELKDLLDINNKLEKRIVELEKVVERNKGTLGSAGDLGWRNFIIVEIDRQDLVLSRNDSIPNLLIYNLKKVLPSNYRLPDKINIYDFVSIPSEDGRVIYSYPVDKLVKMNTQ